MLEKHTRSSNRIFALLVAVYFALIGAAIVTLLNMPKPDCQVHNDNKLLELFMCDGRDVDNG